jgi:hypothetical protein
MAKLTKKQMQEFKYDAERIVLGMGATEVPTRPDEYQLNTNIGILSINIQDGWIACRFEDVGKAKGANLGDRLNPFSGKWNWHEGPDELSMFEHQLYFLMDKPEEYASLCVKKLCAKLLALNLADEQAVTLWRECRELMIGQQNFLTVREIESAVSGSLDTAIREQLLDAISQTMAGMEWPCNGDSQGTSKTFLTRITTVIIERGYAALE